MCSSAFRVSGPPPPGLGGEGAGVKTSPKPSFHRWGCAWKISSRSVQGFGFPLVLLIPTDRQTNKHLYTYFYIYRRKKEDRRKKTGQPKSLSTPQHHKCQQAASTTPALRGRGLLPIQLLRSSFSHFQCRGTEIYFIKSPAL